MKRKRKTYGKRRAGSEVGSEGENSTPDLDPSKVGAASTCLESFSITAVSENANNVSSEECQMVMATMNISSQYTDHEPELNSTEKGKEVGSNLIQKRQEEAKIDVDIDGSTGRSIGKPIPGACQALMVIADELVAALAGLEFAPPVTCVYNPLIYARDLYEQYVWKHGGRSVEVLLVGMNPGPFGMAQTGVPFGDSTIVQEFHGISGKVGTPHQIHPKRLIHGLQCLRHEVSGQRLWGWARDRFHCASNFFSRFWVYNYCPLIFMEASGRNRTPDKLLPAERISLNTACDRALSKTINLLQPQLVIGVGKYATDRIRACGGATGFKVGEIMHPSPANPKANRNWAKIIEFQLQVLGVILE